VARTCKGEYEAPCLPRVKAWKDAVLMPWLRGLMLGEGGAGGCVWRIYICVCV
jgi:hypothetical protein